MHVVFRTNLDSNKRDVGALNEVWSNRVALVHIPRVGDKFRFDRCELEVHRVTYEALSEPIRVEIELHVPSWFTGSINDWEERMLATGRRW